MSPGAELDWKYLYLDPKGRIGRKDFWLGFVVLLAGNGVVYLLQPFGLLAALALNYCWVCLYAKRLHDLGKSGWLQAIPAAINIVCFIVAVFLGAMGIILTAMNGRPGAAAGALMGGVVASALTIILVLSFSALVSISFAIWLAAMQGKPEDNAYGDPRPDSW
jgi:uncharacterized membrane protein YhaH (DUF805 family)